MIPHLPSDAILIDLRGLEPAPERLVEIVRVCAADASGDIVIDWGGRFPWTLDAALATRDAFAEEVVTAVAEACADSPCRLWMVVRSIVPPAYSSKRAYRHLERARRRSHDEWQRALGKLASDLVDDVVSLVPQLSGVVAAPECEHADLLERACGETGIALRSFPGGRVESPAADGAADLGGIEERLVAAGCAAALDRPFAASHEALRRWRTRGWELVAGAHERLVAAEADGARRDRELAAAIRELARHLRGLRAVRIRLEEVYAGLVPDGALARLVRGVELPLREQYGHLAARAHAVRTLR